MVVDKMLPKSGILYKNKTYKYIVQYFNSIDDSFFSEASKVMILGCGIGDYKITKEVITGDVFILVDIWGVYKNLEYVEKKAYATAFTRFYNYIVNKDYYNYSYMFDRPEGHLMMFVLKTGKDNRFINSFVDGKYSEMYEQSPFNKLSSQHKVITKEVLTKQTFVMALNDRFDTDLKMTDVDESEFKPILKQEIFNYPDEKELNNSA